VLNELRAVRNQPLLSELALFAPDLEEMLTDASTESANAEMAGLAKKTRHRYHMALLDWYREKDVEGGLARIAEIFYGLEMAAGTEQVKRLFKVGRAVTSGLSDQSIDVGIATKLLIGRIDREVKRIIDHGEAVVAEASY